MEGQTSETPAPPLSVVPSNPEEQAARKLQQDISGAESAVLQLKRTGDLLNVGTFQGANGQYVSEAMRFNAILVRQAEDELARLKPAAAPDPSKPDPTVTKGAAPKKKKKAKK